MSNIVRYEFTGSWLLFWLLCVSIIGIPVALLYFVNATVRIEDEIEDPEAFMSRYRARRNG